MAIISIPSTIGGVTIPGTASSGPLGALFGSRYGLSSLQYPRDLGSMTKGHFIQFEIYQRKPQTFEVLTGIASTAKDTIENIQKNFVKGNVGEMAIGAFQAVDQTASLVTNSVLPVSKLLDTNSSALKIGNEEKEGPSEIISLYMPDTVNFTYTAGYGETSVMSAISDGLSLLGQLANKVGKTTGQIGNLPSMALSALNSKPVALALATKGLAINPKQQLLFEGISFRTYQMAFTFTPYSREEAETVKKIIKAFKVAALPTIVNQPGGMFFVPPKIIQPSFLFNGKINTNISKVAESVIESVDVNYAPNGWAAHDDGAPVQTILTINFKEIVLIDSKMADKEGF